jgi:hypothetical protein
MEGQRQLEPHRGGMILALGILGLLVCAVLGIIAWVLGNKDLEAMRMGIMDPSGRDLTQAGKICGMIASILLIVAAGGALIALVFGVLSAATVGH